MIIHLEVHKVESRGPLAEKPNQPLGCEAPGKRAPPSPPRAHAHLAGGRQEGDGGVMRVPSRTHPARCLAPSATLPTGN